MRRAVTLLLSVGFSVAVAPAAPSLASARADRTASIQKEIDRARAAGDWRRALRRARALLEAQRTDPRTKPYAVRAAEVQAATLEGVQRLPEMQRWELAESYRIDPAIRRALDENRGAAAESLARRQRDIRTRVLGAEHPETAEAIARLAHTLLDRRELAEPLLLDAMRIDSTVLGTRSPAFARRVLERGRMHEIADDDDRAGRDFDRAYHLYRDLGCDEDSTYCDAMFLSSIRKQTAGDMLGGEACMREAVRSQRNYRGQEALPTRFIMRFLGIVLVDQAVYGEAEELYRSVLDLEQAQRVPDPNQVLPVTRLLSQLYSDRKRSEEAEALGREVVKLAHSAFPPGDRRVLEADALLASKLADSGRLDESAEIYHRVLAEAPSVYGPSHTMFACLLWDYGRVQQEQGDWAGARETFDRALRMMQESGGRPTGPYTLCMLVSLGTAHLVLGEPETAAKYLEEARARYETRSAGLAQGYQRISTSLLSPYPPLALARLATGREDEAWEIMEQGNGRMLADLLDRRDNPASSRVPAVAAREESLSQRILDLKTWIGMIEQTQESRRSSGKRARRIEAARDSLFDARTALRLLQADTERPVPQDPATSRVALADVQGTLDRKTALIGWLDVGLREAEHIRWVYVIRDRGPIRWARLERAWRDGSASRAGGSVAYRGMLARAPVSTQPEFESGAALDLWRDWFAPAEAALAGATALVVVPPSDLLGVPVETLRDASGGVLGDRFAISYVSSATNHVLLSRRARGRAPSTASLLIGDPILGGGRGHAVGRERDSDRRTPHAAPTPPALLRSALRGDRRAIESLPPLPASRRELQAVASLFPPATVLSEEAASERALFEMARGGALDRFGLIHVATHAILDEDDPEGSALVLSLPRMPDPDGEVGRGPRWFDGLLRVEEIHNHWRLNADLVTLSACETALGRKVGNEGYVGFAHAFLGAGARSLLLSMWKVDDEATARLMERFYRNLAGKTGHPPMSKAEALQDAKRWLRSTTTPDGRRPYEHPYYWASFILFGESGNTATP